MQYQSWLKSPMGSESTEAYDDGRAVGVFGFQLYTDTLEQLSRVNLTDRARASVPRVLLHDICDSASMNQLVERYRSHGASAEMQIFPEYGKFLVDARLSVPPQRAFDSVLEWLGRRCAANTAPAVEILAPAADARVNFPAGHETPVVFGGGRYVGVFCQPRCALKSAPAVLFVNAGASHRIGDGRMAVLMARRLAGQGIASLRMDLGGIGDSLCHDNAPTLESIYTQHSVTDATAGVEWLTAAGHQKVVMFGLCSGAYVGIHTASVHPRVVGCMSVNLPFFQWGASQTKPGELPFDSNRAYWRAFRSPDKLLRLLTGRANGLVKARELARRWNSRLASVAMSPFDGRFGINTASGSVRRLIMGLERKGVRTSLVYGALDAGRDELEIHFGPDGRQLDKLTNVTVDIFKGLDHSLFTHTARNLVMAHFEEFLRERILDAGTRHGVAFAV